MKACKICGQASEEEFCPHCAPYQHHFHDTDLDPVGDFEIAFDRVISNKVRAEARLEEAKEQLAHADQAVSDFIKNIPRDFP